MARKNNKEIKILKVQKILSMIYYVHKVINISERSLFDMANEQIIKKIKEDMKIKNFLKYTYDRYLGKQEIYEIFWRKANQKKLKQKN